MAQRLVGERDLERERARLGGDRIGPARAIEDPLQQRRSVDRPGDPPPHRIEARATDGVVGGRAGAERCHVRRDDRPVRGRAHQRRRAAVHVDDEGVAASGRDEARELFERLITQHDATVGATTKVPGPMRERRDAIVAARVGQDLHREARRSGLQPQRRLRLARDDDPRCRRALRATQAQRLDEIDEPIGLAPLRDECEHEIGPRLAERRGPLDEGARIVGPQGQYEQRT